MRSYRQWKHSYRWGNVTAPLRFVKSSWIPGKMLSKPAILFIKYQSFLLSHGLTGCVSESNLCIKNIPEKNLSDNMKWVNIAQRVKSSKALSSSLPSFNIIHGKKKILLFLNWMESSSIILRLNSRRKINRFFHYIPKI